MSTEPYTHDEAELDHDWANASPQQRSHAFNNLLGFTIARAQCGDDSAARILRRLRDERDAS